MKIPGDPSQGTKEDKEKLRELNKAYTECLSRDFVGKFLAGESVKVEDFCQNEYKSMIDLDKKIYGSLKL